MNLTVTGHDDRYAVEQLQLALFGHTHQALLEERDGIMLLNPGTAGRLGRSSYAVAELKNGSFSCRLETDIE